MIDIELFMDTYFGFYNYSSKKPINTEMNEVMVFKVSKQKINENDLNKVYSEISKEGWILKYSEKNYSIFCLGKRNKIQILYPEDNTNKFYAKNGDIIKFEDSYSVSIVYLYFNRGHDDCSQIFSFINHKYFFSSAYANIPKIKIDLKQVVETIKKSSGNENFIFENVDGGPNLKQLYFRESKLDNQYNDFNIGVIEYGFVEIRDNDVMDYIYGEHFYNCESKHKIIHTQTFDRNGIYRKSNIFYYNFSDSSFKLDKIVCMNSEHGRSRQSLFEWMMFAGMGIQTIPNRN